MKLLTIIFCFLSYTIIAQYQTQNSGVFEHLSVVDFFDQNSGYVGGHGGTLLKTTNGGSAWETLNSPTNKRVRSVSVLTANHFYFTAGESIGEYYLYKSTDGGNSFQELTIPDSEDAFSVEFLTDQIGFVSARSGGIYKTVDGGNSWYSVSSYNIIGTQFVSSQVGYAYSVNAIYKTTDTGESWSLAFHSSMASLGTTQFRTMFFSSEGNGHIGSEFYGQLASTNDDWQTVTDHSFDYSVMSIFFTSDMVGYVTEYANPGNSVLKTTDGGVTWNTIYDSNFITLSGQHYHSENLGWLVGSSGTILKYEPGLSTDEVFSSFVDVYPNPANDVITIDNGGITIDETSIYTTSGVEVMTDISTENPIRLNELAEGTYLVRMTTPNGPIVKKFIKK